MLTAVMGAMPDEIDQLAARMDGCTAETYAGVEYVKGRLAGQDVVLCCAGMGKANAASTVQVLATRYGADRLIFSGIAGNMSDRIGVGDVVWTVSDITNALMAVPNIIVVLLLSGLIARETKHYVWDKNLDEKDETPIPMVESK